MDATALAARLDVDLDALGICHACLSFVSMALDSADDRAVRRKLTRVAPDLWAEGLALPTRAALERARRRGDPDADAAIREVEHMDTGAKIVEALVLRLAQDLRDRAHAQVAPDHSGAR